MKQFMELMISARNSLFDLSQKSTDQSKASRVSTGTMIKTELVFSLFRTSTLSRRLATLALFVRACLGITYRMAMSAIVHRMSLPGIIRIGSMAVKSSNLHIRSSKPRHHCLCLIRGHLPTYFVFTYSHRTVT